jgi:hypothetical protein
VAIHVAVQFSETAKQTERPSGLPRPAALACDEVGGEHMDFALALRLARFFPPLLILNSSVAHDENSEKTRTCRELWIHPRGEFVVLDNLLIFIGIRHFSRSQLRNLG